MNNTHDGWSLAYVLIVALIILLGQDGAITVASESAPPATQPTVNCYLLTTVNMDSEFTVDPVVSVYDLSFFPADGSLTSQSLTAFNISQPMISPRDSFYTVDPDVGQENIYIIEEQVTPPASSTAESLASYSLPLNKFSVIFNNFQLPYNSTYSQCTKYDRSTRTAYSISFSQNSTSGPALLLIVALSEANGFAAPSQPIFEMNAGPDPVPSEFSLNCALIPADVSGTSTALYSFLFGDNQLYTVSVTPTSGSLYSSPGGLPTNVVMLEATLVKNYAGHPTLFYLSFNYPQQQVNFGTIDILTGLADILQPNIPGTTGAFVAFEPRVTPPMLVFSSFGMQMSQSDLPIMWTTIGVEQTVAGGDYDRVIYVNSGNFTIPVQTRSQIPPRVSGLFTVGLDEAGAVNRNSQAPLIADY